MLHTILSVIGCIVVAAGVLLLAVGAVIVGSRRPPPEWQGEAPARPEWRESGRSWDKGRPEWDKNRYRK